MTITTLALALLALAALAAAQTVPEISVEGTDLKLQVPRDRDISFSRPRRDDTISIWNLYDRLVALELKNKDLEARLASYVNNDALNAKVNDMRDSVRQELLASFQASMSTVSQAVLVSVTTVQTDVITRTNAMQDKLGGLETSIMGKVNVLINDAVDRTNARTDTQIKGVTATLTNTTTTLQQSVSQTSSSLSAAIDTTRSQLETSIASTSQTAMTAINGLTTNLTVTRNDVTSVRSSVTDLTSVKMWSGYCPTHGRSNPTDYCLGVEEWNTASRYLRVDNGYQFTVLEDGVFRVNFWCISTGGWVHIQILVDGVVRHYGHELSNENWTDNFADLTWVLKKNQVFWVRVYGTNYAYHQGNANGAHSRMQVTYLGK